MLGRDSGKPTEAQSTGLRAYARPGTTADSTLIRGCEFSPSALEPLVD